MRLIDADQLITELEITIGEIYNEEIIRGIYTSIGTAKEQPTVEAKEVGNGKKQHQKVYILGRKGTQDAVRAMKLYGVGGK